MVEFEVGGLYRHVEYGFVECTRKIDNIAVFRTLTPPKEYEENLDLVSFDENSDYEEVTKQAFNSKINLLKVAVRVRETEMVKYSEELNNLNKKWPNIKTDSSIN